MIFIFFKGEFREIIMTEICNTADCNSNCLVVVITQKLFLISNKIKDYEKLRFHSEYFKLLVMGGKHKEEEKITA